LARRDTPSTSVFYLKKTRTFTPTSEWLNYEAFSWSVGTSPPYDTTDVQLRLFTEMENSSGANASIRLDDLRIECTNCTVNECT